MSNDRFPQRLRDFYRVERAIVMGIPAGKLQRLVKFSFWVIFICNLLDVWSTIYSIKVLEGFYEQNIIFAPLLHSMNPTTTAAAVFLKLVVLVIPYLVAYYPLPNGKFELVARTLKLGTFIGLSAGAGIYSLIIIRNISIIQYAS